MATKKILKKKIPLTPLLIASVLINFLLLWNQYAKNPGSQETSLGNVVRIIDGDTFDLEGGIRVRLAGADAPEYPKGCLSLQAKQRLESLILGKKVNLELLEKDNFGRQVAFVKVSGLLVDKSLVEEGLATAQNGENPQYGAGLLAAQDSATKSKRGIWSEQCKGDCLIKGNVRTDTKTKTYHLPGCFNYEKIVINQKEGDDWFCSEEEAQKAGFRKSEDCPEE